MKKDKHKSPQATELRRRAEKRLRERKNRKACPAAEQDAQRQLHELQVHQIELEMQNEELVAARTEVEAGLERYTDLYDLAPVGYFTLGRDGAVRQANLAGARLLGVERANLAKRRFGQFVCDADRRAFTVFLANVFDGRAPGACEVALRSVETTPASSKVGEASSPRYVSIEACAIEDGQACRAVVADTTDRKQAEEARERAWQRERHLTAVLRSIRDVNQLIVREKDRRLLIEGAGALLVSTRGFRGAWIVLTDRLPGELQIAQTGFPDDAFRGFAAWVEAGHIPPCCERATAGNGVVAVANPATECGECPLAQAYQGGSGLAAALAHGGKRLGCMGVSLPPEFANDEQEKSLLREIASDFAYALNAIEMENERRKSVDTLRAIFESASDGILLADAESGRSVVGNDSICRMLGYSHEEIKDLSVADIHPAEHLDYVRVQFERQARGEIALVAGITMKRKDGTVFPADVNAAPLELGGRRHLVGIFRDITERKQAEEELRRSQSELESATRLTHVGHWYWNIKTNEMRWTEEVYRLFGATIQPEVLCLDDWAARVHPDDWPELERKVMAATADKALYRHEYRILQPDGSIRSCAALGGPVLDASGDVIAFQGAIQDITDRKQAEEALRASEQFLRSTVDGLSAHLLVLDDRGEIVLTNKAYRDFADRNGIDPDAVSEGTNYLAVCDAAQGAHAEGAAAFGEGIRAVLSGKRRSFEMEYPCHSPDEQRWFFGRVTPFAGEGPRRVVVAHETITERKRAEEALREAQERLALAASATHVGIFDWNLAVGKVHWTPTHESIFGYAPAAAPATTTTTTTTTTEHDFARWADRIHPDDLPQVEAQMRVCQREHRPFQQEYRIIWPDKSEHWIETKGVFFYADDGTAVRMLGVVTDIDSRKQAEEELRHRSILLATQQEASMDGILIVDHSGRILTHNRRFADMWGIPADVLAAGSDGVALESVRGKLVDPEGFLAKAKYLYEHTREASRDEIVLKDGTILDRYSAPMWGEGDHYYGRVWYFRDITEHRRLQEQLVQSQKMEAIGQLAGGVAHDFRNQLTVIKGFGEMLLRRSLVREEGVDMLQQVLKAADRSTLLTGHLLAFSRKQTLQPEQKDLAELVADIGKAIPRLTGEDVRVCMNPCPTSCVVMIDAGQFQQALMNLVTNARDAMPEGGDLTIATSRREVDDAFLKTHPDAKPGAYVVVAVTDTGSGMDEATLAKIFEPFFTTKEVGQGTGLGLCMVYGFVKQSGGIVEVESQLGKGSTFTLFFPECRGHDTARREDDSAATNLPGGTETLLVVEDEEPVRQMLVESLRESGYTVLHASTVAEATVELERTGGRIDMLITDVVMPGGSGVDLARTIQKTRPEMPILYVSGYAEKELKRRGVTIDAGQLLTKPCSHEMLLTMVRRWLDAPGGKPQRNRKRDVGSS